MKVKICGVTNIDDAICAADMGAWAVGMVFQRRSRRFCRRGNATEIGTALKRRCELVGVFVNSKLNVIDGYVEQCGLTMVQLHGDEGPAFALEVARRTGAKVIKAVRVKDRSSFKRLRSFNVDYYLLDAYVRGLRGGSGQRFDWGLARESGLKAPVILSGGLNPANVKDAITEVEPFAVDVASGVESRPGRKDSNKMAAFFEAVSETEQPD